MNSIGIRREISSRKNPRFPPLRNFQSILFQPSTVGIIYTDTISNTRCRRKCRSAVNVCKLRRERSEITGRPELLLGSLLPSSPFFLIFYRSPAIHPTISVNLNLAQTTRASSILARHFPRGIKLKIESKFRASFFFLEKEIAIRVSRIKQLGLIIVQASFVIFFILISYFLICFFCIIYNQNTEKMN